MFFYSFIVVVMLCVKLLVTIIDLFTAFVRATPHSVIGIVQKEAEHVQGHRVTYIFQYWYDLYPAVLDLLIN